MFTSVASVFYQAREELRKSRPPTIAASFSVLPDLPHPRPLPSAEVNSLPVTQPPSPNPALRSSSLYGSSMDSDEEIPEIDLGDPTGPFAAHHVSSETWVIIDMSDFVETSPAQSLQNTFCSSVVSFIKRLFTLN